MRQFKESSKIQLRFYAGRWYVIWPTKLQYRVTGRRWAEPEVEREEAMTLIKRVLYLYAWSVDFDSSSRQ